jgi:hypothetical protein|eukprot:COSAG01_NODE_1050_length_11922_cov_8.014632_16_plen_76_part_00
MQQPPVQAPGLGESWADFHHVSPPSARMVPASGAGASANGGEVAGSAEQRAQLLEWQRLQREVQQDCVLYREQLG